MRNACSEGETQRDTEGQRDTERHKEREAEGHKRETDRDTEGHRETQRNTETFSHRLDIINRKCDRDPST